MTTKKEDLEFFDIWFKEHEKTMNLDELLMKACSYGSLGYIKKYLDMGANVNGNINIEKIKDIDNYDVYSNSSLYILLAGGYYDYAEYLITRGADVDFPRGLINQVVRIDADTFFFEHVDSGNKDAILEMLGTKLLLKHKANINVTDLYGETNIEGVLIYVSYIWDIVIDYLLSIGENINLLNVKGMTPLDVIINKPNANRQISFLRERGAKTSEELKNESS